MQFLLPIHYPLASLQMTDLWVPVVFRRNRLDLGGSVT